MLLKLEIKPKSRFLEYEQVPPSRAGSHGCQPLGWGHEKGGEGEVSKRGMRLGAACPHPSSVPKGFLHVLIVLEMPEAGYKQV